MAEPPRRRVPATIVVTAVLLVAGGGLTVFYGLTGQTMESVLPPWLLVPYGLLYLLIAGAVVRGRGWGRIVLLVLCGVGVGLALARMIYDGVLPGLSDLAWPLVYGGLVNTPSAREWFRGGAEEPAADVFYDPLAGPMDEPGEPGPGERSP